MRDQLVALARLAEMDSSATEFNRELKELPERIESMRADVGVLETLLTAERTSLDEANALGKEREADLTMRIESLARAKAKGAKARNLREADAAEREVESNRRMITAREEEILELTVTIEAKTESLAARELQFEEARDMMLAEETQAKTRITELEAERAKVLDGREAVTAKVSANVLKRYERLLEGRGIAVSVVSSNSCLHCRMAMPAQLYIEMQRGESITSCPQCNSMIIYEAVIED